VVKEFLKKSKVLVIPVAFVTLLGAMWLLKTDNVKLKEEALRSTRAAVAVQKAYDEHKAWADPLLDISAKVVEKLTVQLAAQSRATADAKEDKVKYELLEPDFPELETHPLVVNLRLQLLASDEVIESQALELNTMYDIVGEYVSQIDLLKQSVVKAEDSALAWKTSAFEWEKSSNAYERKAKLAKLAVWRTLGGSAIVVAGVVVVFLMVR